MSLLLMMTLTILRNIHQMFCSMSLHWDLPDVSLMTGLGLWVLEEDHRATAPFSLPSIKCTYSKGYSQSRPLLMLTLIS